jgi:uncharacterized protein YbjT (DUF2867 family)
MKLLLLGATGLVGSHVLRQALADERVTAVVAPVRRPVPTHAKLMAPVIDFSVLPDDVMVWSADAMICAFGTTMKQAGSRDAFRRVDLDLPLAAARLARRHGTPTFVLNSAMGADARSRFFYNRVKGELEQAVGRLGFDALTLVRPGLIGGSRASFRAGERAALAVLGKLGPVLPRAWRINPASTIAHAMLVAALDATPGTQVIGSAELV